MRWRNRAGVVMASVSLAVGVLVSVGTLAFVVLCDYPPRWAGRAIPPSALTPAKPARAALDKRLPDLRLRDLEGNEVALRSRPNQLPIVIEFGSFT